MAPLIEDELYFTTDNHVDYSIDHYDNQKVYAPLQEEANNYNTAIINTPSSCHRRATVSFDDVVSTTIYDVESISDFTAQEIKDAWYNPNDLRRMRQQVRSDARQLMALSSSGDDNDNDIDDDILCIRGLESRTKKGLRQKKRNRTDAITAVFLEIDFQEEVGFIDEDAISRAYYEYSIQSLISAQLIAKQDELEAI